MRHSVLLLILCISSLFAHAQTYDDLWKEVDNLTNLGQPRSALEKAEQIHRKAAQEDNGVQLIKAVIHEVKFSAHFEEESLVLSIGRLEDEVKVLPAPTRQVLHSLLGEMYWAYWQNNSWQIRQRTSTTVQGEGLLSWDFDRIVRMADSHFARSLEGADTLRSAKLKDYAPILAGDDRYRDLRPTLYHLLLSRALDFYGSEEADLVNFDLAGTFDHPDLLADADSFLRWKPTDGGELRPAQRTIHLMQELLREARKTSPQAGTVEDLRRLALMHRRSQRDDRDARYESALRALLGKTKDLPLQADITAQLAEHLFNLGSNANSPSDSLYLHWKLAYDLCDAAVKALPKEEKGSIGAVNCLAVMSNITQRDWNMAAEGAVLPHKPFRFLMNYRNVGAASAKNWPVHVRVARLDPLHYRSSARQNYGEKLTEWLLKNSVTVSTQQFDLPNPQDFRAHSIELPLAGLPIGTYVIFAATDKDFRTKGEAVAHAIVTVTDLTLLKRQESDGNTRLVVLTRDGGQPVKGARIELLESSYDRNTRGYAYRLKSTLTTDARGEAVFKTGGTGYGSLMVDVYTDGDRLIAADNVHTYRNVEDERWNDQTQFFLDRAIYRPGQVIHFKGLMMRSNGKDVERVKDRNTTVRLFDVNGQEVSQLEVRTNAFGTFSGTFIAPTGGLNGFLRIGNEHGSISFRMEEYKRPKFEVKLDAPTAQFRVGDTVAVQGMAVSYAGIPLDGAEVRYRVTRTARFPYPWRCWGWMPQSNPKQVAYGTATTDATGTFTVRFEAQPDPLVRPSRYPVFTYTIEADITDRSGEMQTGSSAVSVGYHALDVNVSVPSFIEKSELKSYPVRATNLSGQEQDAEVKVTVWQLGPNDRILRRRQWQKPDQQHLSEKEYRAMFPNEPFADEHDPQTWEKATKALETTVRTGKDGQLDLSSLQRGSLSHYLIELTATDAFGKEVTQKAFFQLFDKDGKTPATPVTSWTHLMQETLEPNDTLKLLVASSYPDMRFLLEVEVRGSGVRTNRIIHSEEINLSNAQRMVRIPVTEEWRGNAVVHLRAVRNNELLGSTHSINVPYTNKLLDVSLETFRKEMTPDDKEEWTLRITDKKGKPVKAELLATMYDASLDVLAANNWSLNPYRSLNPRLHWGSGSFNSADVRVWDRDWNAYPKGGMTREFETLNWFGHYFGGRRHSNTYIDGVKVRGSAILPQSAMEMGAEMMEMEVNDHDTFKAETSSRKDAPMATGGVPAQFGDESGGTVNEPAPEIKLRSDFSETVFFHPHLTTDDSGKVSIVFNAPQSLTRWKFMGLATTEDLSIGMVTEEVVTRKLLMVTPNYPRFVREGDKLRFQVKVDVVDSTVAEVNASLEVKDGLTGEESLRFKVQSLRLEGSSAVFHWELEIPEGISALTFTVKAWGKSASVMHTDGEEKTIPVLPNRMLVTEAMPLPVRGKGTHDFTFSKLLNNDSPTLRHHNLTLEFTPNPIWLAVLALPYMMEYPHECAEQIFSRFYANAIGTHLANSDPAIKRVFDQWKRDAETGQGNVFQSQLDKNPELKQALLQETPWVRDAQDEAEQRRRITELFDTERMARELTESLRKLQQQQQADGGWGWFSGLRSDLYITRHIVMGFGKLRKMGVWEPDAASMKMLRNAIEFMDSELVAYYERVNMKDKERIPDWFELHSMYARSFFLADFKPTGRAKAIYEDMLSRIKQHWTKFDATQKGMAAVILHRNGMAKDAAQLIVSLRETALTSEEFGTYWAMEKGYYWHQAPIENHVIILEAFHEVANDVAMVDEMKIWLLKQKQTQNWKTTKATAEACYALLGMGSRDLNTQPNVSIRIGSETIDPSKDRDLKTEAGTGYFKTNWSGKSITPDMGRVTVTKDSEGVAWGAVYWQYFENLDKITGVDDNPIKMKREVMLREDTPNGPLLRPLTDGAKLKVGDRVQVRIVLETDRHMEYVHLKDMRAASFEPREQLSGTAYQEGMGYYRSTTDAAMHFFFSYMPKGTFVFEYGLNVTQAGDFSNGISQLQCMYAPEFTTHSEGVRVRVE
ncbi:MAG: hypothetical protein K9J06_06350 [Flavobacteriales bacterium]|nr:hypothetical protein [Flavobacteriales bacterium]